VSVKSAGNVNLMPARASQNPSASRPRNGMLPFAFSYFGGAFALGFVLGTPRTLWLAPRVGEFPAVALELPLMLGFSRYWASKLFVWHPLGTRMQAMAAGALAFGLLMLAELTLSLSFGRSSKGWLLSLATPPGLLGLTGQLGFAILPFMYWK